MQDFAESNMIMRSRLKELRKDSSLTMEEFGKIVGVARATIARWENGEIENIKMDYLVQLAKYFNVSGGWIMGLDVPKNKTTSNQQASIKEIESLLVWCSEEQLNSILLFIKEFIKPKQGNEQ